MRERSVRKYREGKGMKERKHRSRMRRAMKAQTSGLMRRTASFSEVDDL